MFLLKEKSVCIVSKAVLVLLVTRSFDFVPEAFLKNCSAVDLICLLPSGVRLP